MADIVQRKWSNGQRCDVTLADHPRLRADFDRANVQAELQAPANGSGSNGSQ